MIEAELVYGLCEAHGALPEAGGVLDQSVALIRMHTLLRVAEEEPEEPGGPAETREPEWDFPMEII